ncbi:MAG: DUF4833 domain-containing protein [Endomicrobium sp.]|jgi:hypothetical protein|nr:DUF4833 domain-containing protein [Endomicrobium sp.]
MKKSYYIVIVGLLFIASLVSAQTVNKNIFRIERNKNANVVMYDVRLDNNGNIDKINPIDAYWLLYTKQGQREEITVFEKKAYGFKVTYNDNGYYTLVLKAVPDRVIKVVTVKGEPKAEIKINNKETYLSTVYVFANDGLIPKVLYYILTGTDIETGMRVSEKITVK